MKSLLLSLFLFHFSFFAQIDVKNIFAKEDISIIKETYHLQSQLGQKIWPNWDNKKVSFLYKKENYEILINHNSPPQDFHPFKIAEFINTIYWRNVEDSLNVSATYPINNISTVVMTAPKINDNKCEWVLKAVHEMFHVYQANNKENKLRTAHNFNAVSNDSTYNELNFPYKYYNEKVLAVHRLEADRIYNAIQMDSLNKGNIKILQRRFADLYLIYGSIVKDSLQLNFKSNMEWTEGVARYVEQQIAKLASDNDKYIPTPEFTKSFPNESYYNLSHRYSIQSAMSPIRFVGEGVIGRIMFYYTGMGKAYLLDKIKPGWKERYFKTTLDEQIIGEEQFLMCKSKF